VRPAPRPPPPQQQHAIRVELAERLRVVLAASQVVEHRGGGQRRVADAGHHVAAHARPRPHLLQDRLAHDERLPPREAHQRRVIQPQVEPRHALPLGRVADERLGVQGIPLGEPPGQLSAECLRDLAQVAVVVGVAEFAEDPGARRPPVPAEVIDQRVEVMQIAVEVVITEVGEVKGQPAVGFAGATVVADQHARGRAAHNGIQPPQQIGVNATPQLAAQAVQDHRGVVVHRAEDLGVLARGLLPQAGRDFRQPHRQLQPQKHAQLVRQIEVQARRHEQTQLDQVVAQGADAGELGADRRLVRRGAQDVRVPAPVQHPAQADRPPVKAQLLAVAGQGAEADPPLGAGDRPLPVLQADGHRVQRRVLRLPAQRVGHGHGRRQTPLLQRPGPGGGHPAVGAGDVDRSAQTGVRAGHVRRDPEAAALRVGQGAQIAQRRAGKGDQPRRPPHPAEHHDHVRQEAGQRLPHGEALALLVDGQADGVRRAIAQGGGHIQGERRPRSGVRPHRDAVDCHLDVVADGLKLKLHAPPGPCRRDGYLPLVHRRAVDAPGIALRLPAAGHADRPRLPAQAELPLPVQRQSIRQRIVPYAHRAQTPSTIPQP